MAELSPTELKSEQQGLVDSEHLKLLSWAYLGDGCLSLLYSIFPLLFMVVFGAFALSGGFASDRQEETLFPFIIFASFVAVAFFFSGVLGGLKIFAGICIRARRRRAFCLVVAALSCLAFPYGTILGIATFYVLQRESVASQFNLPVPATENTTHPSTHGLNSSSGAP